MLETEPSPFDFFRLNLLRLSMDTLGMALCEAKELTDCEAKELTDFLPLLPLILGLASEHSLDFSLIALIDINLVEKVFLTRGATIAAEAFLTTHSKFCCYSTLISANSFLWPLP